MLLSVNITLFGQNMNVQSFELLPNDMDARVHASKLDQNGKKAAIIKIESTEKGFAFDTGSLGIVGVNANQVAETWVYIPQGAIRLSIKHAQLGVLEYEFPIAIKEATVYRLKLTSSKVTTVVEESAGGQYFMIKCSPAEAEITIGDDAPIAITAGEKSIFLPYGKHTYKISSRLYKTTTGVVEIGTERMEQSVTLKPDFGYLRVATTHGSTVEVNDLVVGKTPYFSDKLPKGSLKVRISQQGYETLEKTVNITGVGDTVEVKEQLIPYFSEVKIAAADSGASIYINEEYKGKGSWSGNLMPARYVVRIELDGHRSSITNLDVKRNTPQTVQIESLTPMYGTLNINSTPTDANVYVDGKYLGVSPNIFSNVLAGNRSLLLTKDGYENKAETIKVEEGKVFAADLTLEKEIIKPKSKTTTTTTKKGSSTSKPTTVAPKEMEKKHNWLLLAQADFNGIGSSYGAMLGYCDVIGAYGAFRCGADMQQYLGGLMIEVDNIGLYGGIGGASFSDYEFVSSYTGESEISSSGMVFEVGLTYKIKRIMLSIGMSTVYISDDSTDESFDSETSAKSMAFNFGIGFRF